MATQRYALVTGANKGIGFEICRQLASKGIVVILTSRNEKRGIEAFERLKELGLSDYVVFHQLDVIDPASVAAAVEFITTKYGRLDILASEQCRHSRNWSFNYSRISGKIYATSVLANGQPEPLVLKTNATLIQTYNGTEDCVQMNFYGAQRVTRALTSLLKLSESPTIVIVACLLGHLKLIENEHAKSVLGGEVLQEFLEDFKEGRVEENKWPSHAAACKVSKAALILHTLNF